MSEYETIIAYEDQILAVPRYIRYNGESGLYIFDSGLEAVVKIEIESGEIIKKFGRRGQGPGEFRGVNQFYLTRNYLYLVDQARYFIYKYHRDGYYVSVMDFGDFVSQRNSGMPILLYSQDMFNLPVVLFDDLFLFPSHQNGRSVFELRNWNGDLISEVGELPEGSTPQFDIEEYRESILNREIPGNSLFRAFPLIVADESDLITLVYSSIPKLATYDIDGNTIQVSQIPETPETDLISDIFFETMEMAMRGGGGLFLRNYVSGIRELNGEHFVATYTNRHAPAFPVQIPYDHTLWIHRFSQSGELIGRYQLVSEVMLEQFFDVDFTGRRIFVITEDGEIRSYHF